MSAGSDERGDWRRRRWRQTCWCQTATVSGWSQWRTWLISDSRQFQAGRVIFYYFYVMQFCGTLLICCSCAWSVTWHVCWQRGHENCKDGAMTRELHYEPRDVMSVKTMKLSPRHLLHHVTDGPVWQHSWAICQSGNESNVITPLACFSTMQRHGLWL